MMMDAIREGGKNRSLLEVTRLTGKPLSSCVSAVTSGAMTYLTISDGAWADIEAFLTFEFATENEGLTHDAPPSLAFDYTGLLDFVASILSDGNNIYNNDAAVL